MAKVRIIYEVSARVVVHKYGGRCGDSYHCADKIVHEAKTYQEALDWAHARDLFEDASLWETPCERCGAAFNEGRSYGPERIYDTASGKPEVNDMFTVPCPGSAEKCFHWDNCIGQHLHVICPDGTDWDIDSRANNCTMPEERTHRCWVRVNAPPNVTVGKDGYTCGAGAGSIQTPGYHGMFTDGEFHP